MINDQGGTVRSEIKKNSQSLLGNRDHGNRSNNGGMIARGGEKMNRAGWELKKNFPAETQSRGEELMVGEDRKEVSRRDAESRRGTHGW